MSDAPDIEVLVCMRVADMANPPVASSTANCQKCGMRVWVSMRAPAIPLIVCMPCAMDDSNAEFDVADETMAEVKEYLARTKQ